MAISPQGYIIEKDPTSTHPFWSGSSELPSGLPGQTLVADENGVFVPSDSLIDLKTETDNIKEELQTVHQDQGDLGDDVNEISGNVNHLRGGTTGQILYKTGNADFAFGWKDEESSSNGLKLELLDSDGNGSIKFSSDSQNVYVSFTNLIIDTSDYYDFPISTNITKRVKPGSMQQIDFVTNYHRSGAGIYIGGIIYIQTSGVISQVRLYELEPVSGNIYESLISADLTTNISGIYYMEDVINV